MENFLEKGTSLAKEIISNVTPIISWVSNYLAGLVDIPEANVHIIIVLLISIWLGKFISAEKFTMKHFIISGIIFVALKWLGL